MQTTKTYPHLPVILTSVVTVIMVIIVILSSMLISPLNLPSPGVIYEFSPGISVQTLGQELADHEVIKHPWLFDAYLRMNSFDTALQAGEYYFPQGISTRGVAMKIFKGQVIKRSIRVHEGWTVNQLINEMKNQTLIKQTLDYSDPNWYKKIIPDATFPEGLFMPDTYIYKKGISDILLLKRMHRDLQKFLNVEWNNRDPSVPYQSPYQALIVASIVEKETAIPMEREEVAGVLVRRLAKKMRLQMDPTVIYGMGTNYHGTITKNDLRNPTPYNTYLIDGLPPTPIALPSRQSIHAALHPQPGTSLYFVAKGDGSHIFTDTLEDHNAAVLKYILHGTPSNKDTLPP
jgi:UPF0755 protein